MFRGVPLNVFGKTLAEVMENNEWKGLVNVLKCGIGKNFDINKLYYNRINILTDADVDGFFISAMMLVFFFLFMPQLILEGYLYKVFSPLYHLDDKEVPFVASKNELVRVFYKKIVKTFKLAQFTADQHDMSKDEFMEFLSDTFEYRDALINAAEQTGKVNKFLVEDVIAFLVLNNKVRSEFDYDEFESVFNNREFVGKMMTFLKKKYPELTVNEYGIVDCIVNGERYQFTIDRRFYRKTAVVIDCIRKYGYLFIVEERGKDSGSKKMTLAEFLDLCQTKKPKIITRYKGLGELNGDQLYDTTLDINHRMSVKYTMADIEDAMRIIGITHGSSKESADGRKEMMYTYKINKDDLDN